MILPKHKITSRANSKIRGLSLVEVMIAIALLSIALISLMTKIHDSIDLARISEYQNASRDLAKQLMADIEAGTVEDVLDGLNGNFENRGYSEITWMIGRGDASTIGADTATNTRKLYDTRASDTNPFGQQVPIGEDPNINTETDEACTRVRIVVTYPTVTSEKFGTFTLEKMLPTACVNGTQGIREQQEKDQAAAAAEAKSPDAAADPNKNGGGSGNKNNSSNKKPGTQSSTGASAVGGMGGPK
jgi:prepilin-type N-terminal cleavage/methylation domain-containing protein